VTQRLTPGKWRGLKQTSTSQSIFAILAFDQRGNYVKMLPEGTPYKTAVQIKTEVVTALSPHTSAVLLDPIYGLQPALHMAGSSGLLMALEKSGYSGDSTYRRLDFIDGWTVDKIKRMGASAAKLLVYYHPDSGPLADELDDIMRGIAADCRRADLPFFVEPLSYSLDPSISKSSAAFAATRPAVVRETARRLSGLGVDVLKLEFPVDAAFDTDQTAWRSACEAISEVCAVPWVLLSAGVDFDTFEAQVATACQAGASGFLAGRAIWKEGISMDTAGRMAFLKETAVERVQRLTEIAARSARPWSAFFAPPTGEQSWFTGYAPLDTP
jgi:tagatose 1,6-diphosphate aldolase